jgi:hypothetical protein
MGWLVKATPRPLYPGERDPVPIVQDAVRMRKISVPRGLFCVLSLCVCTSSLLVSLSWLSCILPFVFTYNTQHKYPCPQRDSKPQSNRWSAADPRLRPPGHWDRHGFDPRTVQPVASRCTDWAVPAHLLWLSVTNCSSVSKERTKKLPFLLLVLW